MAAATIDRARLERDGFSIVADAMPAAELVPVGAAFDELVARRGGAGSRAGLEQPACRALVAGAAIRSLVEPVLGAGCVAVRATLFDKTAASNWLVAWHQDITIPVRERRDADGFGPWSCKDGVLHVQAPTALLRTMLAVRIHLDAASADNGPLRVLPGTHTWGKLPPATVARLAASRSPVACLVPAGGVLLMRPLLLHASSRAIRPVRRRVLHVEFASGAPPGGLQWHAAPPDPRHAHGRPIH